jgi:hypothetical protein
MTYSQQLDFKKQRNWRLKRLYHKITDICKLYIYYYYYYYYYYIILIYLPTEKHKTKKYYKCNEKMGNNNHRRELKLTRASLRQPCYLEPSKGPKWYPSQRHSEGSQAPVIFMKLWAEFDLFFMTSWFCIPINGTLTQTLCVNFEGFWSQSKDKSSVRKTSGKKWFQPCPPPVLTWA